MAAALSACSDYGTTAPTPTPPAPATLLRDVVLSNLPSPYYHFVYDASGRIVVASFASGLTLYDVRYDGGKLVEMRNNTLGNQDVLKYSYDGSGRVGEVRYVGPDGVVNTRVVLTYAGQQLTGLRRERLLGAALVLDKTLTLTYYGDGNLRELTDHRAPVEGLQNETTTVDRFERYDDKVNVDGFGLIHGDFFDHLILLPGVHLQRGNPGREILSGDGTNVTVDYTYTYDDRNRPLVKSGAGTITNGPDAGRPFQTRSEFSYY